MKNKIDLLEKEENLNQDLDRYSLHASSMRFYLKKYLNNNNFTNGQAKKIHHYLQVFAYYQNDLIPALQETIQMSKKHLEILRKNPDKSFKPVKLEVQYHHKLTKQFFNRFDQLKLEIESFINQN